jgi:hypothetical protein
MTLYLTSECKDKNSANPSPLLEVPPAEGGSPARLTHGTPAGVKHPALPRSRLRSARAPRSGEQGRRECRRRLLMADRFIKSGEPDKARDYLQTIIREYGDSEWAEKARQRLDRIDAADR